MFGNVNVILCGKWASVLNDECAEIQNMELSCRETALYLLLLLLLMFYITYTSTLKQQIRTLLFLEIKLKTFDNVVFALNKNGLL